MNSTKNIQVLRSQRKLRRLAINKNTVYDCSIIFMNDKQCEIHVQKQLKYQMNNAKRKNESPEKRELRLRKQREINNRNRQADGWKEYQKAYQTISKEAKKAEKFAAKEAKKAEKLAAKEAKKAENMSAYRTATELDT